MSGWRNSVPTRCLPAIETGSPGAAVRCAEGLDYTMLSRADGGPDCRGDCGQLAPQAHLAPPRGAARSAAAIGEMTIFAIAAVGIAAGKWKARSVRRQIAISPARLGDKTRLGGRYDGHRVPAKARITRPGLGEMFGIQFGVD